MIKKLILALPAPLFGLVSMVLWLVSLFLPALGNDTSGVDTGVEAMFMAVGVAPAAFMLDFTSDYSSLDGFAAAAFVVGWMSLFLGVGPNILVWVGIACLLSSKHGATVICSTLALFGVVGAGMWLWIGGLQLGYWVWASSSLVLLLGGLVGLSAPRKTAPMPT